ncbi:catalase [Chryseobacterium sp. Leaf404]|uniref:catalase n=1 Tax=unclassified Chryseobacterium TaxID=2593645 RepID=UPI0006FA0093|nr:MULTISPECIES: catalase [unclassified Chryseobacterium]KQT17071.1 catalase [Chryseobacterium sp. Leaf404]
MLHYLKYNKNFDKLSFEEKKLLDEAKKSIEDFVEGSPEISDVNFATRNAHAKTHSVLQGVLKINPELSECVKYIFDKDEYDIVARISNANLKISKKQKQFPAYGFAFKIKDDAGRTIANYPLVNFPLFPVNCAINFLQLFTNINRFYLKKIRTFFPLLKSCYKILPSAFTRDFLYEIMKFLKRKNNFILSQEFYSVGAFRMDDRMVKIKIIPVNVPVKYPKKGTVRKKIRTYFKDSGYTADVMMQVCYDLTNQPINKLNVHWKNTQDILLGQIVFEKNSVLSPNNCEHELLSFNPFESAEIFQPVGKIQKLRDEAYKASLQTRKKINKLLKYK